MRKSDTVHQSYDHDVGQSARQQSHDDHTGQDPRIAHDGHGCYDRMQWDASVELAATASTAASCQHGLNSKHTLRGTC